MLNVIRESGGGFPGVRALGLDLPRAGVVQVSMNVEDWEAAALHDIAGRMLIRVFVQDKPAVPLFLGIMVKRRRFDKRGRRHLFE